MSFTCDICEKSSTQETNLVRHKKPLHVDQFGRTLKFGDMSRNARTGENGKNTPNFDEYIMTKQRGALRLALLTKVVILAKMANNRQIGNKISNEIAKGLF